jgi:filamentous hemagglutinin family protein
MNPYRSSRVFKLGLDSCLAIAVTVIATEDCGLTQIVKDNTLGAESSIVTPIIDNNVPSDKIDGGAIRGTNLFHSFQEFNVGEGQGVYFTNPDRVENILSRVTGGSRSNILGTLGVLGNANLFLINPNGIIFGPKGSLDIRGSFIATTANSLNFADSTQFSANASQTTPLLTTSIPIGLQFGATAESIRNQSRATDINDVPVGLKVDPSRTLALVGGEVLLEGGYLTAEGGWVELGVSVVLVLLL